MINMKDINDGIKYMFLSKFEQEEKIIKELNKLGNNTFFTTESDLYKFLDELNVDYSLLDRRFIDKLVDQWVL